MPDDMSKPGLLNVVAHTPVASRNFCGRAEVTEVLAHWASKYPSSQSMSWKLSPSIHTLISWSQCVSVGASTTQLYSLHFRFKQAFTDKQKVQCL